jgi:hypothetical protein
MRNNLYICGNESDQVERAALEGVLMPPATRTYQPYGHAPLVDQIEDCMAEVGFRFGEQVHHLTKDGKRYFGMANLMNGTDNEQHALVVGIRNSLDKAFAASILFGAQVFICDNLSWSAEKAAMRKHTTNIERDLPGLIMSAVSQTKVMQHNQDLRFERYQEFKITDRKADSLIVSMLRRDAINTSRVGKVVSEWYEPQTDHGPKRAWRLFNAATEALKDAPLHDTPRRTLELQAIMDDVTGFVPQAMAA